MSWGLKMLCCAFGWCGVPFGSGDDGDGDKSVETREGVLADMLWWEFFRLGLVW